MSEMSRVSVYGVKLNVEKVFPLVQPQDENDACSCYLESPAEWMYTYLIQKELLQKNSAAATQCVTEYCFLGDKATPVSSFDMYQVGDDMVIVGVLCTANEETDMKRYEELLGKCSSEAQELLKDPKFFSVTPQV